MSVPAEAIASWGGAVAALVVMAISIWVSRGAERRMTRRSELDTHTAARARAASVSAWIQYEFAVVEGVEKKLGTGLIISNGSGATVTDIQVDATANSRDVTFIADVCPPGIYRAEWKGHPGSKSHFEWGFLTAYVAPEGGGRRPYSFGERWRVRALMFQDGLGDRWANVGGRTELVGAASSTEAHDG